MTESDNFVREQEQRQQAKHAQQLQNKQTLEVTELEQQQANLPAWQQWIVNILAVIGGLTVAYLVLSAIF